MRIKERSNHAGLKGKKGLIRKFARGVHQGEKFPTWGHRLRICEL